MQLAANKAQAVANTAPGAPNRKSQMGLSGDLWITQNVKTTQPIRSAKAIGINISPKMLTTPNFQRTGNKTPRGKNIADAMSPTSIDAVLPKVTALTLAFSAESALARNGP
jgi:hypothetical protein